MRLRGNRSAVWAGVLLASSAPAWCQGQASKLCEVPAAPTLDDVIASGVLPGFYPTPRPQAATPDPARSTPGRPTLTVADVLGGRYPVVSDLPVSSTCKEAMQSRILGWAREDLANWGQLSNQACSHALGWIERVPGTCQAGGPPPICPVDHWIRNPGAAQARWRTLQAQKAMQRDDEVTSAACGCYAAELRRAESAPEPASVAAAATSETLTMPCAAGQCPPGMACAKNGFCEFRGRGEVYVEKGGDLLLDKASDYAQDKYLEHLGVPGKEEVVQEGLLHAIEAFGASRAGILATMTGRVAVSAAASVIVGLFDAKAFSLNRDGYKGTTERMTGEFEDLKRFAAELQSLRRGGPARAPQMIRVDIERVRAQLTNDVQMAGIYFDGINRERELDRHGCYEVLGVQHQQLMNAYGRIVGLTAMTSGEISPGGRR
jgi:hypothetical protein